MLPANEAAKTRLIVTPLGRGERWMRRFDDRTLVTSQREVSGGELVERFGPLELRFTLEIRDGALLYRQAGAELRSGPLRIPLARLMGRAWRGGRSLTAPTGHTFG